MNTACVHGLKRLQPVEGKMMPCPNICMYQDKVYLGFGRGGGGIRFITGGASALGDLKVKINFNNPNPPVLTFWVLAVMSVETAAPVQTFPFSYLCTVS